jgi:D-psicose/D-tagatose/L-ribulose 3-epimerase
VEPLNRYETSLLNTVEQTLTVLAPLPADGVGVALDVYHQNIEERDLPAAIRAAGERIAHVQVCANDRGTPGRDHLDWPGILAALDDAAYTGPLCIESFTAHNASIARAASIWRPLADTQDALAVDGLRFLRSLQED